MRLGVPCSRSGDKLTIWLIISVLFWFHVQTCILVLALLNLKRVSIGTFSLLFLGDFKLV